MKLIFLLCDKYFFVGEIIYKMEKCLVIDIIWILFVKSIIKNFVKLN